MKCLLKSDISSCPQGDIGMEGPRGGVGGPGETVRKTQPHPLCGGDIFHF